MVRRLELSTVGNSLIRLSNMGSTSFSRVIGFGLSSNARHAKEVIGVSNRRVAMRIFRNAENVSLRGTSADLAKGPVRVSLSPRVLNEIFSKLNEPVSNLNRICPRRGHSIGNTPVGPMSHRCPHGFVRANVSSVSTLTALVHNRGLPVFSNSNVGRGRLTIRVMHRSAVSSGRSFTVIFTTVNIGGSITGCFHASFRRTGMVGEIIVFLGLSGSPVVREVVAPHYTLATTRCLTFALRGRVLMVLASVASCTRTLHRFDSSGNRVPDHGNFPNCLCSSLTSLCRHTNVVRNIRNSIARVPVLAVPGSSVARPVPSLANCVARNRVILSHSLSCGNVCPPIGMLSSLSHLVGSNVNRNFAERSRSTLSGRLLTACTGIRSTGSLTSMVNRSRLSPSSGLLVGFNGRFSGEFLGRDFARGHAVSRALSLN